VSINLESIHADLDASLRRFLARRLSDPSAVEDVLQETYLRIHRGAQGLREPGRVQGWVYQIARNALIDYYRRRHDSVELPESLAAPDESTDDDDAARELARSMRDIVACLPEKYHQALVLTEFEGLKQHELAKRLGISVSGAKSRVQRARDQLRSLLLECCHVELDRAGRVLHYEPRCNACAQAGYFARRTAGCGPDNCV
jgi:RNA polymerase sigma-70 factor, ECF subfamily